MLSYLESAQTAVLCGLWLPCSQGLRPRGHHDRLGYFLPTFVCCDRDVSVGILIRQWGREPRNRISNSDRGKSFFCLSERLDWAKAHRASYSVYTADIFVRIKRPVREFDHSHQSIARAENAWSYTSTPPYAFMAYTGTISPLVIYVHRVS